MLRDCILSTDIALHLKLLPKLQEVITVIYFRNRKCDIVKVMFFQNGYVKSNLEHRKMLHSLIMTCADLSDQTKVRKLCISGFSIISTTATPLGI